VWVKDNRNTSTAGYRGLLLQARSVGGDTPVGMWLAPPTHTKRVQCSAANDTITHSEAENLKNEKTVYQWKATGNHMKIRFVYV